VVFNLGTRTPEGRESFLEGRELIFHVHSCITYDLFEFWMGSLGYSGLIWVAVQKRLKTTAVKVSCFYTIQNARRLSGLAIIHCFHNNHSNKIH